MRGVAQLVAFFVAVEVASAFAGQLLLCGLMGAR